MSAPTAVTQRCHDDPDPECPFCVFRLTAEAVKLMLRKKRWEAYHEWDTTSYNQLTVYLDFLERVR